MSLSSKHVGFFFAREKRGYFWISKQFITTKKRIIILLLLLGRRGKTTEEEEELRRCRSFLLPWVFSAPGPRSTT